jgi:CubicO group peptidase (beta-lactamase class C family)
MKLTFILLLFISGEVCAQQAPDSLVTGQLTAEGIDSGMMRQLENAIQQGVYPNVHSLLIARHGKLVYEHYWPGSDEILGAKLGVMSHGADKLHDMRSITKSFVGACIGIAIAQGKIKNVDVPIFSFFPEFASLDTGMKARLTLRHLLTMSSGLDWDETRPYTDPLNSEIAMDRSPDPVGYVLSRPMLHAPGTEWRYNGGNTEVLAAIIKKVSGKPVDEFAKEYIFGPLGIDRWYWFKNPPSHFPSAAAGLRLCSRDLLKFGLLYADRGKWDGKQVIPAVWVDSSLAPHITRGGFGGPGGYGYQFWTFPQNLKDGLTEVPAGVGNGDQRVFIDRKHALVVVVTAGNYNNFTIRKNSNALLAEGIYPAIVE